MCALVLIRVCVCMLVAFPVSHAAPLNARYPGKQGGGASSNQSSLYPHTQSSYNQGMFFFFPPTNNSRNPLISI